MRRYLKYDIKHGLFHQYQFFFVAVLLICCSCILYYTVYAENQATLLEYIMYMMKGEELRQITEDDLFVVPIQWLAYYVTLSYITGYYARKDWETRGMYSMLAGKSRVNWWLSKCVWCLLCVFCYYLISLITMVVYALCTGGSLEMTFSSEIMKIFCTGVISLDNSTAIMISLLLPFLTSCAICMVQMLLSFFIGSVVSFALTCAMYIMSCYYISPLILGNYLMWMKSSAVTSAEGMDMGTGIFASVFIMIVVTMLGIVLMDRRDVLGVSEEN